MSKTKIQWADRVWNPITGCSKVSAGCKNCYAERMARRFWKDRPFTHVTFYPERLSHPETWPKKHQYVFVNSMSDLFHKDVSYGEITAILEVIQKYPYYTFMVLTKRPENALVYFNLLSKAMRHGVCNINFLPIRNLWIGVSVENQEQANKRIPLLLQIPAAIRFVSCEPLVGPVDLTNKGICNGYSVPTRYDDNGHGIEWTDPGDKFIGINWVIAGGESGPHARPMHPDWVRSIRQHCLEARVPFWFKQWGAYIPEHIANTNAPFTLHHEIKVKGWYFVTDKGHAVKYDDYSVSDKNNERDYWMAKVGKTNAGNCLDGYHSQQRPEFIPNLILV